MIQESFKLVLLELEYNSILIRDVLHKFCWNLSKEAKTFLGNMNVLCHCKKQCQIKALIE